MCVAIILSDGLFNYQCPHVIFIVVLHSVIFHIGSCPHMIRCILLSDIPHVLVVSGTLDMTPCFLDMCVFLIRT